mmetsp:Transcript_152461/g.487164  ORF Transcript_152461/g.487164 Transcript_152461/m.487164 type:complete len:362 (-) Transcript_152461:126-1211(-)
MSSASAQLSFAKAQVEFITFWSWNRPILGRSCPRTTSMRALSRMFSVANAHTALAKPWAGMSAALSRNPAEIAAIISGRLSCTFAKAQAVLVKFCCAYSPACAVIFLATASKSGTAATLSTAKAQEQLAIFCPFMSWMCARHSPDNSSTSHRFRTDSFATDQAKLDNPRWPNSATLPENCPATVSNIGRSSVRIVAKPHIMLTSCCGSNSGNFSRASSHTLATSLCIPRSSFATDQTIFEIVWGFFCLSYLTSSLVALEASHLSRSSFLTSAWSWHFARRCSAAEAWKTANSHTNSPTISMRSCALSRDMISLWRSISFPSDLIHFFSEKGTKGGRGPFSLLLPLPLLLPQPELLEPPLLL